MRHSLIVSKKGLRDQNQFSEHNIIGGSVIGGFILLVDFSIFGEVNALGSRCSNQRSVYILFFRAFVRSILNIRRRVTREHRLNGINML